MNTQKKNRIKQRYALLMCAQFFRDELDGFSPMSERHEKRFSELRELSYDALNDLTEYEADIIKADYQNFKESENV